jgi:iduronate 2-sulfatase
MMGIASSSNHLPFLSPEPQFQLDSTDRPDQAIRNTVRYTDDVVREFIESLRQEPWFARTLVIITGDHGYNLGEHGPAGQNSGWRESVWVPLLIHGAHPRLPRGGHDVPASLLDIAPTVTDLLGIREATPWMGTSLVTQGKQPSFVLSRGLSIFGEQGRFSMVVDPASGQPLLYDALDDPVQTRDISSAHPGLAATLRRRAEDEGRLTDYLLEANRIWQDSVSTGRAEATRALR